MGLGLALWLNRLRMHGLHDSRFRPNVHESWTMITHQILKNPFSTAQII